MWQRKCAVFAMQCPHTNIYARHFFVSRAMKFGRGHCIANTAHLRCHIQGIAKPRVCAELVWARAALDWQPTAPLCGAPAISKMSNMSHLDKFNWGEGLPVDTHVCSQMLRQCHCQVGRRAPSTHKIRTHAYEHLRAPLFCSRTRIRTSTRATFLFRARSSSVAGTAWQTQHTCASTFKASPNHVSAQTGLGARSPGQAVHCATARSACDIKDVKHVTLRQI